MIGRWNQDGKLIIEDGSEWESALFAVVVSCTSGFIFTVRVLTLSILMILNSPLQPQLTHDAKEAFSAKPCTIFPNRALIQKCILKGVYYSYKHPRTLIC